MTARKLISLPMRNKHAYLAARDVRALLYMLSLGLDCIALAGGYGIASLARDTEWLSAGSFSLLVIAIPIFVMFSIAREAQSLEALENRSLGTARALGALGATAISLILLIFLSKAEDISRFGLAITFAAAAVFLTLSRLITDLLFTMLMGRQALARLLILDGADAQAPPGTDVLDAGKEGLWPDLTRPEIIDRLSKQILEYDRVIVASQPEHRHAWSVFLRGSDVGGELLLEDNLYGAVAIGQIGSSDTLILSRGPLAIQNRILKRMFDLALALPLLVFLGPMMMVVALAIRLESAGPALFRQTRIGQGNRQFTMLKFRSMRQGALDAEGARSTDRDDDRITAVGKFIRKTSIDELPQLLNVIRGEMSMIGPRPHALGSLAGKALFWEVTEAYWLRHALKPGISGLAQIRGLRGTTRATEDLTDRLRSDLEYLSNWSVWLDLKIALATLGVVVHKNAY